MKMIAVLLFLFSTSTFAGVNFWVDAEKLGANSFDKKTVVIEGIIQKKQKHIRARTNYFWVELKDPHSEKFVRVKLFTIKWLKRINKLPCGEDDKLRVSGIFRHKQKGDRLGDITIKGRDKKLKCLTDKVKEGQEAKDAKKNSK